MSESIGPDQIQLRQGATSHLRVEVWCDIFGSNCELPSEAYLEGPFSERGRTLTSKFPFTSVQQRSGPSTWRALLPEPVFWTPRMPAYYELRGVSAAGKRIGLRELFVRRNSFFREDRRWVPRAAFVKEPEQLHKLNTWTDADLVPIVRSRGTRFAEDAVVCGLPVIADLSADCALVELLHYIPYASVTMAVVPSITAEMIPTIRKARSCHLPVGIRIADSGYVPEEAQFAVVSDEMIQRGWQSSRRLPVVVTRELNIEGCTPAELRAACDQFQAELDDGAGYAGLWLYPKTVS